MLYCAVYNCIFDYFQNRFWGFVKFFAFSQILYTVLHFVVYERTKIAWTRKAWNFIVVGLSTRMCAFKRFLQETEDNAASHEQHRTKLANNSFALSLGLSLRFAINNYNNIESLVYGRKATTATLLTTTNHNKIRSRVECQKTEVKWRPMACFSLESSPSFPFFRQFVLILFTNFWCEREWISTFACFSIISPYYISFSNISQHICMLSLFSLLRLYDDCLRTAYD